MKFACQCSLKFLMNPSTSIHLYISDVSPSGFSYGCALHCTQLQISSKRFRDIPVFLPSCGAILCFDGGLVAHRLDRWFHLYFVQRINNPTNCVLAFLFSQLIVGICEHVVVELLCMEHLHEHIDSRDGLVAVCSLPPCFPYWYAQSPIVVRCGSVDGVS
jgi:hypothetical protein